MLAYEVFRNIDYACQRLYAEAREKDLLIKAGGVHGSSPLDNETERCRRIISPVFAGFLISMGSGLREQRSFIEALEAAYLSVQQNLPPG